MIEAETIVNVQEAGRVLGLGPQRTRQLIDAGDLPAVRTSTGMRLVKLSDAERLAEQRATRSAAKV